jgi:farnesyl diphosphate synthase
VERALDEALPTADRSPQRLHAAMRYAVLNGGKRLRPLLVYAAGAATGAKEEQLDAPAAAVELIHAFSLVHDDLPSMDDDALRRGRPTIHVAFDEACAILTGDALQTLAFGLLADADCTAETRIGWVRELAAASGAAGMCGGQALDMAATGRSLSLPELENLHTLKTGALIRAAVRMGASPGAHVDAMSMDALDAYAAALGLAFQIRDDILDLEGDSAQLGKTAGKDLAQGKSTHPAVIGMDGAKQRLDELAATIDASLVPLGTRAEALRAIAHFTVARAH